MVPLHWGLWQLWSTHETPAETEIKAMPRYNPFVYFPPQQSTSSAQLSNTFTTGKGNIKCESHQKLVDTGSHLLPACNTPFNRGWSIITQAKILGTDFQPDSYAVLADPLTGLVDMSRFLQHAASGRSEWAFFCLQTFFLPCQSESHRHKGWSQVKSQQAVRC